MISLLITLLILLLIVGVIWYCITSVIPLPPPIGKLAQIILIVVTLLIFIWFLLAIAGMAPAIRYSGADGTNQLSTESDNWNRRSGQPVHWHVCRGLNRCLRKHLTGPKIRGMQSASTTCSGAHRGLLQPVDN